MKGLLFDELTKELIYELNPIAHKINVVFTDHVASLPQDASSKVGTIQLVGAFEFSGDLIATSISTVQICLRALMCDRKIYYLREFEWVGYTSEFHVSQLWGIMTNPELIIVPRTEEIKNVVESLFKRKTEAACPDYASLLSTL